MIEERWEKTNNINSLAYKAGNIAARSGENDVIVNRQVWLNRAFYRATATFFFCRRFTWNTRSEGNETDGSYGVFESDTATEM
jgi:hypothetical protein